MLNRRYQYCLLSLNIVKVLHNIDKISISYQNNIYSRLTKVLPTTLNNNNITYLILLASNIAACAPELNRDRTLA